MTINPCEAREYREPSPSPNRANRTNSCTSTTSDDRTGQRDHGRPAAGAPADAPAADRTSLRHRLTVDGPGHVVRLVVHRRELPAADGVEEHRPVEDAGQATPEALV